MSLVASTSNFMVQPNVGLLLWNAAWLLAVPAAAVVTGLKGHWGWLLAGFALGGLLWLVSAWFPPRPDSWWARRHERRQPPSARPAAVR